MCQKKTDTQVNSFCYRFPSGGYPYLDSSALAEAVYVNKDWENKRIEEYTCEWQIQGEIKLYRFMRSYYLFAFSSVYFNC